MARVLLVKLGAIGDVVMLLPAAHLLHGRGHQIDWICGKGVEPLLRLYPWINPIVVNDADLFTGGVAARAGFLAKIWKRLLLKRYDLVATLYYDRRLRLLTLPVIAQKRMTLSHEGRRHPLPDRHHTDEYARLMLEALGEPERGPVEDSLAPVAPAGLPASPLAPAQGRRVVLVPAGAKNLQRDDALRRWPMEHYVALSRMCVDAGYEVVLCGGPKDDWAVPYFAGLPFVNLIGRIDLPQLLALFAECDAVVTHDTGPLHLAGLTARRILGLFGPVSPFERLPRRDGALALWGGEGMACRPCYDGRDYAPCEQNDCLRRVSPETAFAQLQQLLGAGRSPFRIFSVDEGRVR